MGMEAHLSPRELEVLLLAAAGKTVVQSAVLMGVAGATVRNHRVSIMRKMQADNMTHAVSMWYMEKDRTNVGLVILPDKNDNHIG